MPKRDKFASPYGKPVDPIDAKITLIGQPTAAKSIAGGWIIMDELFGLERSDSGIHSMAGKMTRLYERQRKEEAERYRAAVNRVEVVRRYGDVW